MREMRNARHAIAVKPDEKRQIGKLKVRREDSIKMYIEEIMSGSVDWIKPSQYTDRCRAPVDT
jgi:hypothetical protein